MIQRELTLPVPATRDQVIAFGNRGEGKSLLLYSLMLAKPHLIFVDSKQAPEEQGWIQTIGPVVGGEDYTRLRGGRYVYQPPFEWADDLEMRNRFFKWALQQGNRVIFLDEIADNAESAQKYPRYMKLCSLRGRAVNLGLWGTTQQPRGIPTWMTAQASYLFTFYVGLPEYRERIDEIFQQPVPWGLLPLGSHHFVWKDQEGMHGPYHLDLNELHAEQGEIGLTVA